MSGIAKNAVTNDKTFPKMYVLLKELARDICG